MVRAASARTRRVAASQFHDDITQCPKLEIDTEKQNYAYSSRDTSFDHDEDSHIYMDSPYGTPTSSQPILGRPQLPLKRKRRFQFYRVPQSIMRWICLGVFMSLLLFIAFLFRFSLPGSSFRGVQIQLSKARPRPAQWESFSFLTRYYGGIRTLVSRQDNVPEYPGDGMVEKIMDSPAGGAEGGVSGERSEAMKSLVFNPYPDYKSESYIEKYGVKNDCFLDADKKLSIPPVRHFPGIPKGFPDAAMGSNKLLGINDDVCFDRFGRLGPYGLGYGIAAGGTGGGLEGDRSGIDEVWKDTPAVDFRTVKWAEAQERCVTANNHRFPKLEPPRVDRFVAMQLGALHARDENTRNTPPEDNKDTATTAATNDTLTLPRSVVIIRTWSDYKYNEESIMYLRSLIAELSLMSGGEYTLHFLIQVKDDNLQIWSDDDSYYRVLKNALPPEFHGMGTLWSERQMGLVYGGLEETFARDLPVHGVYRSTFMPVQYFSHQHPEYDFIWNWEMDVRYTGHWYHFFRQVSEWAKQQPRKGLWERNSRFYVPSVHGSWEDFRQMIRVHTDIGTDNPNNMWATPLDKKRPNGLPEGKGERPIWGPERPHEQDILETDGEGIPPTTYEKDKYEWGVGEDADLIVFNPLFDPEGTTWLLRNDVTGYNKTDGMPPRRAAIITTSRLSRKLLATMHRETSMKRHSMFSEMWPATAALHHGLKAVYAPHSVYMDRRWPTKYLESTFNAGRNGATGASRISVFGDREHNFRGTTWYYSAGHSPNLWRRWFGYRVDGGGGEEYELATEGRMCLPPILLHPIKELEMIIESLDR
ncbi:hypothetical protein GX50_03616 [[Emmonsia] crescens]|uniref:Major facilitator superfamily transporter n=1 Tax=[Emmonsia] crescens TaxID=73230 RepID=A0A2B7ZAS5_9EURO|nr:hypothetical protein GX50_03616 [Emmonsia crescens]